MPANKIHMLSAMAGLLLCAGAQADDSSRPRAGESPAKAAYEGADSRGGVVRLIITDVNVQTFQRVGSPMAVHYPQPHWTARIGTGTAAANEH
jgi:hypothetical protein